MMGTRLTIRRLGALACLAGVLTLSGGSVATAATAREMYYQALERERGLRSPGRPAPATLRELRLAIGAYEAVVRRYPRSGYSDNALWQGAGLALLAYERFHETRDRQTGERLLQAIVSEYPTSSLISGVAAQRAAFGAAADDRVAPVRIRRIGRTPRPDAVRVEVELDGEVPYHHERLANPDRLFFDFRGTEPVEALRDQTFSFGDDVVRKIRLGRHPNQTTRVVFDLTDVRDYSIFALHDPYRLVIDFQRAPGLSPAPSAVAAAAPRRPTPRPFPSPTRAASSPAPIATPIEVAPLAAAVALSPPAAAAPPAPDPGSLPAEPVDIVAPAPPVANTSGSFSLSRQLGLGISRVVIDPGHGGRDPGARGSGLTEAAIVLDVAKRLKTLLERQGIEVLLTRETDVFIPLEERTRIANAQQADLFLSIHVNASRNQKARGVETYFLNFASHPEAEEVAARENSSAGGSMYNLTDIVEAIALNNKLDESRELATLVQRAVFEALAPENDGLRDLGVKQAPFVVLIGAQMPSVLAELSFVSNRDEARLLSTDRYRQLAADALLQAVLRYQRSLKNVQILSEQND